MRPRPSSSSRESCGTGPRRATSNSSPSSPGSRWRAVPAESSTWPARSCPKCSGRSTAANERKDLPMKFGMFYVLESPDGDYQRAYKEMFGQIEYAEELGFDSVWLAEHHGSAYGSMPSPQLAMSSIAMITERMRIGLAVSI